MASATKQALLAALSAAQGECISGQQLAQQLGVSRAAVHKAAAALAAQGYALEAAPRRGYRLAGGDPFCAEAVGEYDAPIYLYDKLESSNRTAKTLALEGAPHGTMVLTSQQTAGRGRMGRSFQSPAGLGLYGSVLLRSSPEDAPRIPALAATAVRRAIRRSCGLSCGIKWPNDLVLSGRKVCGILAEALPGPEGSLWVVVGIGINVCQRREDFLPELRETAASLSMIAGAEIDRAALETAFLEELEALRRELPQETAERRQEYGAACLNLGHRVRVLRPGGEREALAVSLTPDYGLAVRYDDGTEEVLRSGEVSVRGLYGYTDKE